MNAIESILWNFREEDTNQQMYRLRNMIQSHESDLRLMQRRLKELEAKQGAEILKRYTRPDND